MAALLPILQGLAGARFVPLPTPAMPCMFGYYKSYTLLRGCMHDVALYT